MESNNTKAMREALEKCHDLAEVIWQSEGGEDVSSEICDLKDRIAAALLALGQPRNCDVGTAEEQAERYTGYCDKFTLGGKHCETCPCCGKIPYGKCEFAWANMPYEEGGAK